MPDLDFATPSQESALRDPQLCRTVDGVEFWVRQPRFRDLRCVITDAALTRHYGATNEPASWLRAFLRHRPDIEQRALAASGRRDDVHVVLLNDPVGMLKATAGRCVS